MKLENVSKMLLNIKAPGYAAIALLPGKGHSFKTLKDYAPYSKSCSAMKQAGWLKLVMPNGMSDKDIDTAVNERKQVSVAQAEKAKMAAQVEDSLKKQQSNADKVQAQVKADKELTEAAEKIRKENEVKASAEAKEKAEHEAKAAKQAEENKKVAEALAAKEAKAKVTKPNTIPNIIKMDVSCGCFCIQIVKALIKLIIPGSHLSKNTFNAEPIVNLRNSQWTANLWIAVPIIIKILVPFGD